MFQEIEVLSRNCDVLSMLACKPNILTNVSTGFVSSFTNAEIIPKIRLRSPPFPTLLTCYLLMLWFVIMVVGVTETVVKHTIQLKDPHCMTCLQIRDHYILWY